jgi:hypothetical protein
MSVMSLVYIVYASVFFLHAGKWRRRNTQFGPGYCTQQVTIKISQWLRVTPNHVVLMPLLSWLLCCCSSEQDEPPVTMETVPASASCLQTGWMRRCIFQKMSSISKQWVVLVQIEIFAQYWTGLWSEIKNCSLIVHVLWLMSWNTQSSRQVRENVSSGPVILLNFIAYWFTSVRRPLVQIT